MWLVNKAYVSYDHYTRNSKTTDPSTETMGNPAQSHWGPSLEHYVAFYRQNSGFYRNFEPEENLVSVTSSARAGVEIIIQVANEDDEAEVELLATKITFSMLQSIMVLSSSMFGIAFLANPRLVRGCIKLMKTIRSNGSVTPFSYEYGYLCFNIAIISLGLFLSEKLGDNLDLAEHMIIHGSTGSDRTSILIGYLSKLILDIIQSSKGDHLNFGWIFGWGDSPAQDDDSELSISKSDTLELLCIMETDRKALMKALSLSYTPGISIILLLVWQYTLQGDIFQEYASQSPLIEIYLDLVWRFALNATVCDLPIVGFIVSASTAHIKHLRGRTIDAEDSETIIKAYINGIPLVDGNIDRCTALRLNPHSPYFIQRNILPGTKDLFPALVETLLYRTWEIVSWDEVLGKKIDAADLIGIGIQDLGIILDKYIEPASLNRSSLVQAALKILVNNDLLDLMGVAIQRLQVDQENAYEGRLLCQDLRKDMIQLVCLLAEATRLAGIVYPSYFFDYIPHWLRLIRHNKTLLLMGDNSESFRFCPTFRQKLIWEVLEGLGIKNLAVSLLRVEATLACSYTRCPSPEWVIYTKLTCAMCMGSPHRAVYCSSRCQILDWTNDLWNNPHSQSCPSLN